jgi:uncharacterized membrane protein YeaQ/YmgE (transglycosylase-associated protein family)
MQVYALLLTGTVIGFVARYLVPGRPRLTWSETTVAGLLGAGAGSVIVDLFFGAEIRFAPIAVAGALAGAVAVVAGAEWLRRRYGWGFASMRKPAQAASVSELIAGGERDNVEFKYSARFNIHTGARDRRLEYVIAKTVAGFANAGGGVLLIGVDDDGNPVGLERDFALVRHGDRDRYELWLHDLLEHCLGRTAVAGLSIDFASADGREVCRVAVEPATRPVFCRPPRGDDDAEFYVRLGNSTRRLAVDDALAYVDEHFKT